MCRRSLAIVPFHFVRRSALLLSKTGIGIGVAESGQRRITVEIRSVNNRYFKLALRCPDRLSTFEPEIEKLLREKISRGTLNVSVRLENQTAAPSTRIQQTVLKAYWEQLAPLAKELKAKPPRLSELLELPGVLADDTLDEQEANSQLSLLKEALSRALAEFEAFRAREGAAMQADLCKNQGLISAQVQTISDTAPQVITEYRDKLLERVNQLISSVSTNVTPADIIREVSLFADKCDINEELARLASHFQQFEKYLADIASQGRKIEFLMQEMFREINTIGSKANQTTIAHCVVEMKTSLERMREVIQNVE
jgi:uncharacterized protein (TIGR00255 family)